MKLKYIEIGKANIAKYDKQFLAISEMAAIFNITKQAASMYNRRGGFPEPYEQLSMSPIWSKQQIVDWLNEFKS